MAELAAASLRRFSSPEYWPLHPAKALTTISRSVSRAGVGVRVGADAVVEVGSGVAVAETVDGAAVGKAVAVAGSGAAGDGRSDGAGDAVS